MQAQITIGGSVYGGGNEGKTGGSTSVTVYAGDINAVYGGARMADVGGSAFVNIDGEHASDNIFINTVYGGNDIAGTVGADENNTDPVPTELTKIGTGVGMNAIDNTWNAFIRTSPTPLASARKSLVIGSMFGGGNGDYDYTSDNSPYKDLVKPELGKTYLEILGGCIAHLYGGGNNATVTENTTICIDNDSPVLTQTNVMPSLPDDPTDEDVATYNAKLVALAQKVNLSTFQSDLTSYAFNFARVFGGNNKAEMKIRPIWNLQNGIIRDLYSGGNQGAMTSPEGLLLNIDEGSKIVVENLYGGCRMADVIPRVAGVYTPTKNLVGYNFPDGFSARVVISGGDVNNVYGGNDISGKVYGGNAVGIRASVRGDVYGGGNGSYAYTDNAALGEIDFFKDFYYNPSSVPGAASSVDALHAVRPNAEQVSIRVVGTKDKPTIVHGGIFCGGNCATIMSKDDNPTVELKIGSYVIADSVFLGNNGANMVKKVILEQYAGNVTYDGIVYDFSSMDLTDSNTFATYMDGAAMSLMPSVVFDSKANGDAGDYEEYTSYFGSFFCGGNVGSMTKPGKTTINFNKPVYIYNKVVGGCNNANIYASNLNAEYLGGLLGEADSNSNKLELNFNGLKIQPKRWKVDDTGNYVLDDKGNPQLEWNTISASTGKEVAPVTTDKAFDAETDLDRRFKGGNIYGGCYNSGHVNGNVVINLNASIHERDKLFDVTDEGDILYENTEKADYIISKRNTGVILSEQGMDVLGAALNVFGGGYGADSEIWGSTTINLNKGYTFQIFGGGEMGAIGNAVSHEPDPNDPSIHNLTYEYNPDYSTYINLNGAATHPGVARGATGDSDDMAECEFIYGGAFEGPVAGDTHVNLNNGRIFNSFAGSCNANVLGHTETYVGQNGFPWIRDHIYGGNDLGGSVLGNADFSSRIRDEVKGMVAGNYGVASYMEYTQGRVRSIFGGSFGDYDYTLPEYKVGTGADCHVANKPYLHNTFVNIRPNTNGSNSIEKVFGAGEGNSGDRDGDRAQDHSYVLIDIPNGVENFANTEIFGAGAYNGLGMRYTAIETFADGFDLNEASAIIDLLRGQVGAAYGGSYEEGVTRRTLVNVPEGSTIKIGSIFGGAYGSSAYNPCDVYEANVNWLTQSEDAYLINNNTDLTKGFIYGGNNHARRTLYSKVNIDAPVRQKHYKYGMTTGTVYGAGCGPLTWNEYTEVNLNAGAKVYEVYGGAEAGSVMSAESVQAYYNWNREGIEAEAWKKAWSLGQGYDPESFSTGYTANTYTNLNNPLVRVAEMDDRDSKTYRYNTNVIIHKGAYVGNYAYGGGLGKEGQSFVGSGDVYGTTYIALLGGTVNKDIYAAGTLGAVYNLFGAENYTASTNAYIAGGTLRNVYGGGWKGDVGYTTMTVSSDGKTATFDDANEKPGEAHVVIGIRPDQTDKPADYGFYNGVPAIQRNAYGGGEGGAVYGSTYLTLNNGYVGYEYKDGAYQEKVDDDTYYVNSVYAGEGRLKDCGNLFGGGYDVRSSVDTTCVTIWNGIIRNSVHGGGEIATVGRGAIDASGPSNSIRTLRGIYKAGKTNVELYNGHVLRNMFGGGKGYNIFGYGQQGTLYMDGYVFGQTEVHVHGGEVGTDEGLAEGYGNVFGGGDIGYVYSPSVYSTKTKAKTGTGSPGHIYYYNSDGDLTEDCKVVVSPYLQVMPGNTVTYNGVTYQPYDYVPTDYLNTLPKKNSDGNWGGDWLKLDAGTDTEERGVHIHNAVFAGGNVSSNSDQTYANATTVFGNTTATLYDVYHRDFITVGTEHTGGLYGGGNLSVVDGYRELNITNYGTDYYGLKQTISIDEYRSLSNRERAYFQLEYKCIAASETNGTKTGVYIDGTFYETDKRLTEEEYLKLANNANETVANLVKSSFEPYGFCSIYAGRLLNTIQRADLCGVFGSRMVLQGAKDRVAEVGEDIDYTINRVGELSLNQQHSVRNDDTGDDAIHGNYFGIYSLVNYLGNLTSDVRFGSEYVNGSGITEADKTYYSYKSANPTSSDRNKGKSFNQVALASGVFLELTTENSTKDKKDYGYVTGVVELDLINVKKDLVGGGFVYAKNEHRVPMYYPNKSNVILSEYNNPKTVGDVELRDEARTYKRYRYSLDQEGDWSESEGANVISGDASHVYQTMAWQTSGNFIHPSKRIVDDCYPINNAYTLDDDPYSEAHYWYVKGEVYIYNQKVSAYTGSANAYSKEVHLPLTITAASNGKLQLLNVKPNLYAYYTDKDGVRVKIGTKDNDDNPIDKVTVNNESDSYGLNDVITWWDWHQLSASDRQYFVTETYVNCVTCTIDGTEYEAGTYVMDQTDYDKFMAGSHDIRNGQGEKYRDDDGYDIGKTFVFRSSNNISHETGYVLTFDMNSPKVWDDYYSPSTGDSSSGKIMQSEYEAKFTDGMTDAERQAVINAWREGPTFTPTETGVYGKRSYKTGEVITEATYQNAGEGKDKMERAYVATEAVTYTYGGTTKTVNAGTAISETEYNSIGSYKNYFAEAWFCTNSVKLTNENYMLYGELKSEAEIAEMKAIEGKQATDAEIDDALTPAYICTADGEYGGQRFETGTNYSAIQAWSSLPEADREKFNYNYDALDLLVSSDYLTVDPNVTSTPEPDETAEAFHAPYTDQVDVEYQAVFKKAGVDVSFNGSNLADGAVLTNKEFETIRNDRRHYTHLETKNNDATVFIAKTNFVYLGTPYGVGQLVDADVYNANPHEVEDITIPTAGEWYYCYEDYEDEGGQTVSKGTLKTKAEYGTVPNYQQYFIIQGQEPTETTTLYVSRESNAYDVMKERVYSVVYQYTYYEDEDDGSVKMTNELHVVNIHLDLESGVPQIGPLSPPATVLPGNAVGLKAPDVNPGLYEVLTSGWELYATQDDADNHRNGVAFENNNTPVYWYQNQKNYISFYSKTYLGKTYSNPVPLSVANYHDLDAVMSDKEHHMYVDNTNVDRPSKIYIDNRDCTSDPEKSELDLLKDFFDLSVNSGSAAVADHASLDSHVRAGQNLEFFLNSDVSPKKYTSWTPIGDDSQCFEGDLHGDGHTVSGLSSSLFGKLCGSVYNLGVTGSFTSAGVVDRGDGYVENCWVSTTGTPDASTKAVFGNPTDADFKQVVNCYYPSTKAYADGAAHAVPEADFYNGTVAYNLNAFYLNKRYYDGIKQSSGRSYNYLESAADGTLSENMVTGYYPATVDARYGDLGYVEKRYEDGDFRYAGGTIPESTEIRYRAITTTDANGIETVTPYYSPIWPDDYIFFGQTLSYGYDTSRPQQELPASITKSSGRLIEGSQSNRVYRAPAYYGNKTMSVAHFNPAVNLAATFNPQSETDASPRPVYPGMTAIDFAGHNDLGYQQGASGSLFYTPLLDDDGLVSVANNGETQNLLFYAPSEEANEKTFTVLNQYVAEPAFADYDDATGEQYTDGNNYRRVAVASTSAVLGHLVQSNFKTTGDHLLVDRQDFNAPMAYTLGADYRMWYQRTPDNYVDRSKGWEAVSLPFSAELVTTQDKGEITHFYRGSETGHEYWLREYKGGELSSTDDHTFVAQMEMLNAGTERKDYSNTFLWDYYYSKDVQKDKNSDQYQKYYSDSHTYNSYPYLANGTPYVIGLPGDYYYEFDLSGVWTPRNRYQGVTIDSPGQQIVTFASMQGVAISVSDTEMAEGMVAANGYTFVPNYSAQTLAAGTGYVLSADGSSFAKSAEPVVTVPFRPYFTVGSNSRTRGITAEKIVFGGADSTIGNEKDSRHDYGTLKIYPKKQHTIVLESSLNCAIDVRILTPAGITLKTVTVQPGETLETRVNFTGVYLVQSTDGYYTKKVEVR